MSDPAKCVGCHRLIVGSEPTVTEDNERWHRYCYKEGVQVLLRRQAHGRAMVERYLASQREMEARGAGRDRLP